MYKLVLVEFPFTEKTGKKVRPALLLTNSSYGKHKIVVVAYVTSTLEEGLESEVKLESSAQNGLEKDSIIKLHKLINIPESIIKGEIGVISAEKSTEVKKKLKDLLHF